MRQQGWRTLKAWAVVGLLLGTLGGLEARADFGVGIVDPTKDDGTWGFEIGNGRRIVRNMAGRYGINIPEKWEAGLFEKFTEVIAPLYEGTPRARLSINIVKADGVRSPSDLMRNKADDDRWTRVEVGGLEGIKRDAEIAATGLHEIDIELVKRADEIVTINLAGKPKAGSFNELFSAARTMRIN